MNEGNINIDELNSKLTKLTQENEALREQVLKMTLEINKLEQSKITAINEVMLSNSKAENELNNVYTQLEITQNENKILKGKIKKFIKELELVIDNNN